MHRFIPGRWFVLITCTLSWESALVLETSGIAQKNKVCWRLSSEIGLWVGWIYLFLCAYTVTAKCAQTAWRKESISDNARMDINKYTLYMCLNLSTWRAQDWGLCKRHGERWKNKTGRDITTVGEQYVFGCYPRRSAPPTSSGAESSGKSAFICALEAGHRPVTLRHASKWRCGWL